MSNAINEVESWLVSLRDSGTVANLFTAMNKYAEIAYGSEKSNLSLEDSVAVQSAFARVFSEDEAVTSGDSGSEDDYWDQSEAYSDDY